MQNPQFKSPIIRMVWAQNPWKVRRLISAFHDQRNRRGSTDMETWISARLAERPPKEIGLPNVRPPARRQRREATQRKKAAKDSATSEAE